MQKSEFLIYAFFIFLLGIGLGMIWRAHQVESLIRVEAGVPAFILEKATLDPGWAVRMGQD